ncbi:hypothetical protein HMPREF9954_1202 [Streptococcus infantis SK970]|nr:hypothetical protein HMPREF9954_1202 [Streptococcus infantis SK970]
MATTQQSLMNEWDYVNNLLIANPTEITELSNMSVWWDISGKSRTSL